MINIGICDDVRKERQIILYLCEKYFEINLLEHEYVFFTSGEDALFYCKCEDNKKIDVLFLDVEMSGISGLELKDAVLKQDKICRIVFVTNHNESIYQAFSRKTIGFINKPSTVEEVKKILDITIKEMQENVIVRLKDSCGIITEILLEDIIYFKASGSYTEIATKESIESSGKNLISTKKMGVIEKEMRGLPFVRVHKSYMVNIANVIHFGENITLSNCSFEIPVGRKFQEQARVKYLQYGRTMIRKRL